MTTRQTINTASTGRYSSQMLTQSGAQRSVAIVGDQPSNVFNFGKSGESFLAPENLVLGFNDRQVVGSLNPDVFDAIYSYFLGVSGSKANAQTMALVIIDAAKIQGVNPMIVLDRIKAESIDALTAFLPYVNKIRSADDQHETTSNITNAKSLKSRYISP